MQKRNITIKRISIDGVNFFDIEGNLDLSSRILNLNVPFSLFKEIFKFKPGELLNGKMNMYNTIFACDDNRIKYSCFNCIFGFKYTDPINLYTAPIDCILENKLSDNENIYINKLTFITSFPKKFGMYIASFKFKYTNSKQICIKKTYDNNDVIIEYSIISDKPTKFNSLSNILYAVLELTFLLLGDIPNINKIILFDNEEIVRHIENAPKYTQRKNIYRSSSNGILSFFNLNSISSNPLKQYIKFRKQTKILFDLLMININNDGYIEITNSMLVQLLEGLYKTINNVNEKELRLILEFYFIKNPLTNTLLTKRDLKDAGDVNHTPIFLLKAKEHRNYLSHLNMNQEKKVFYQLENNYAFWKLSLATRIYIMQTLNMPINQEEFNKMKDSIEKWAKNNNLRYKK